MKNTTKIAQEAPHDPAALRAEISRLIKYASLKELVFIYSFLRPLEK